MTKRTLLSLSAAALAASLAACGGGAGGGSSPIIPGGGGSTSGLSSSQQSEAAISAANSLGTPLKNVDDDNAAISLQSEGARTEIAGSGTCSNYTEFFAPDKNGDANSTESVLFYDAACTQPARDAVRIFTSTGANSETVARTTKLYALGNSTAVATRTESASITNASFDANGFPKLTNGFDRTETGSLSIGSVKTIDNSGEDVVLAQNAGVNQYCSDAAGFNATGIPSLNETFGWNGGTSGSATRTINGDGTVTWNATHAGTAFKGAIGALSIATGTQNTACPIATPMFTLAGGTSTGSYSIPVVATYKGSLLTDLTIANAQLANGSTLSVTTNTGVPPTNSSFISGTIGKDGTQIATFNVDAFGDGTLTVTASGDQFVITDWHVIK